MESRSNCQISFILFYKQHNPEIAEAASFSFTLDSLFCCFNAKILVKSVISVLGRFFKE